MHLQNLHGNFVYQAHPLKVKVAEQKKREISSRHPVLWHWRQVHVSHSGYDTTCVQPSATPRGHRAACVDLLVICSMQDVRTSNCWSADRACNDHVCACVSSSRVVGLRLKGNLVLRMFGIVLQHFYSIPLRLSLWNVARRCRATMSNRRKSIGVRDRPLTLVWKMKKTVSEKQISIVIAIATSTIIVSKTLHRSKHNHMHEQLQENIVSENTLLRST